MPYVRARVSATVDLLDRPLLRGDRFAVPEGELLLRLLARGIVEVDPDQAPPSPPPPPARPSLRARIRERYRLWRRDRQLSALLRQSPFRNVKLSDAIVPVVPRQEVPLPPAARSQLWTPGAARPIPTLAVVECRFGCRDAATCPHVRV